MARGLRYLHSIEVIHGNLKGVSFPFYPPTICLTEHEIQSNILIDPDHNPRLTGFGRLSISGSARWRAPELLEFSAEAKNKEGSWSVRPTYKSDTYSLAMVVIEVTFLSSSGPVARSEKISDIHGEVPVRLAR